MGERTSGEEPAPAPVAAEAITLASAPVERRHRRAVWVAVLLMGALFAVAVPFAKRPLGALPAFLPLFQSALIACEAITGVLLFGQFRTQRSVALLILAGGYFFSAFMAIAHLLSFPGLLAPAGVIGGGAQTTAWLYFGWHAGFPLFVIAYAVARRQQAVARSDTEPAAGLAPAMFLGVVTLVAGLTVLATVFEASLPVIMAGHLDAPAKAVVAHATWLTGCVALVVLLARRPPVLLDMWLIVVMGAWLFDVGLSASLNHGRFDLGWYAGRMFGLAAAVLVLVKLLLENSALHRQVLALRDQERRRAAERLRSSERRFEAIFEQAPVGIAHVSLDGHWLQVNTRLCEIMGYPAEELKRCTFPDILSPGGRAAAQALRRQMLAGQIERHTEERRYVRRDGRVVWVRVRTALVREADGAPAYFVSVVSDLTEQRVAEDKVHVLNREMARMAQLEVANQTVTALAHELNQPLSAVSAAATAARHMLHAGHWSEARLAVMLDGAEQAALRAGQVLQDMVSFINQGKVSSDPIDINGLLSALMDRYRHNHAAADYTLRLELQPDMAPVLANRLRLEKVLTNLIDNGIEAMLDRGARGEACVTVSTRAEGATAHVRVADAGPGLDPASAERIFDPFFTTKTNGLGMGLAVSRAIVESHGGHLWAESPADGGAVFHLTLPLAAP
ncbi:PAS domain S-box protein [Nitrogeniibacter mangrovi]|uniref:histidine kinase n=1 Tax=Nitrogeniibacter mangrovi TaxID=2016596 RepID=A0A6C1B3A5_9RHOO|nr:MASE4 domain-containing protein [Nitrogeniibacter mangrovi]QID16810.1 PAS domain S-box protein [Nitrogeniibacter mangrovi]